VAGPRLDLGPIAATPQEPERNDSGRLELTLERVFLVPRLCLGTP